MLADVDSDEEGSSGCFEGTKAFYSRIEMSFKILAISSILEFTEMSSSLIKRI